MGNGQSVTGSSGARYHCKDPRFHSLVEHFSAVPDIVIKEHGKLLGSSRERSNDAIFSCQWNPNRRGILATTASDSTAVVWDINRPVSEDNPSRAVHVMLHDPPQEIVSSGRNVRWVEWANDGVRLATACTDDCLGTENGLGAGRVINVDGGTLESKCPGSKHRVHWNPSNSMLLSDIGKRTVLVWDPIEGKTIQGFKLVGRHVDHEEAITNLEWITDDQFAVSTWKGQIQVFQVGRMTTIMEYAAHNATVAFMKWNPQSGLLASAGRSQDLTAERTVKIWSPSTRTNRPVVELRGHTMNVVSFDWSPVLQPARNSLVVTGSADSTVRVWDVETSSNILTLVKFPKDQLWNIRRVLFSRDGNMLLVVLSNGMFLWDVRSQELIRTWLDFGQVKYSELSDIADFDCSGDCICVVRRIEALIFELRQSAAPLAAIPIPAPDYY